MENIVTRTRQLMILRGCLATVLGKTLSPEQFFEHTDLYGS